MKALATLAEALLARGDHAAAREAARSACELRARVGEAEEGDAHADLLHAETLAAVGHQSARAVLVAAHRRLLERAAAIGDPALRQSFIAGVPEHARMVALARAWGLDEDRG